MEHEAFGQRARFERYAANLMYIIAAGQKLDTDRAEKFIEQVDDVYRNPFERKKKPKTAAEIKEHILGLIRKTRKKLEGHHGSDDAGGENHAG